MSETKILLWNSEGFQAKIEGGKKVEIRLESHNDIINTKVGMAIAMCFGLEFDPIHYEMFAMIPLIATLTLKEDKTERTDKFIKEGYELLKATCDSCMLEIAFNNYSGRNRLQIVIKKK